MGVSKLIERLKRRWALFLAVIVGACFLINVVIFYPGYMSNDSISHLLKVEKLIPLNDMQPPIQDLLWGTLFYMTGRISSMLLFQLMLLWGALYLLALYMFRKTASYRLSLLPVLVGFLPFVLNISGVIWSDVQLAFSFLMAVVLVLYTRRISDLRIRYAIAAVSLLLITYGCLVRYNGFFAVLPLLFLVVKKTMPKISTRTLIGAVVVCVLLIVGTNQLVRLVARPQHVATAALFAFDDVLHVNTRSDLKNARLNADVKSSLIKAKDCVDQKRLPVNTFWSCVEEKDWNRFFTPAYGATIKQLWISTMLRKPLTYLGYKMETFARVLFPAPGSHYVWHNGIIPNPLGLSPKFVTAGHITQIYVLNFGYKHFSWFYEPWFWLVLLLGIFRFSSSIRSERQIYIRCLCLSGILYILGYATIGVTVDYRYVYWPVLAGLTCLTLVAVEYKKPIATQKQKWLRATKQRKQKAPRTV